MIRQQLPVYSPVSLSITVTAFRCALDRGWAARGEAVARRLLESRFGATAVLLTDSGTTALRLALIAERAKGPVALPAYGCYDLASAAIGAGVRVLLYDLDLATLGPDESSLRQALERGARTVVVVHPWGYPVALDRVADLCRIAGALLIEDAAQAAAGKLDGAPLGGRGPLAVLSFGRGKGLSAGGGGALLGIGEVGARLVATAAGWLAPRAGALRLSARLAAQWLLARPAVYGIPAALPFLHLGETVYRAPHLPREAALAVGAVLNRALPLMDNEVSVRRRNAERLLASVGRSDRFAPVRAVPGAEPGYLRLPVRVTAGDARRAACSGRRLGVVRGYPISLAELPQLAPLLVQPEAPVDAARALGTSLLTLPTHSLLAERDLRALERWVAAE
jgi:perosamine synthetase